LELIQEFGKAAVYKANTQKPVAFLYTNDVESGRAITKTIPCTLASKRIKYL